MRYILTIALAAISCSLAAQELTLQPSGTELVVNANGVSSMTALQFNLELPEGVTLADVDASMGEATVSHTLCVETLDNGDLLFILYSMNLNTFKDGELLHIPININGEGTARLYNVRFADTEAVSYAGEETATGIASPKSSPKGKDIYNLSGQQMVNGKSLNSKLPRGIYIKGGKKILAK